MTFARIKVNWLVVGTIALVLILVFAAFIQYRLINRASEADRRQHREYIETTLRNFSGDFRESMLGLLPVFRPFPAIPPETTLEAYLRGRAAQWRDNSDRPQLLGSVSFGTETPGGVIFKRLRAGENSFTEQTWPAELTLYRTILEKRLRMPGGEPPLFPNGFAFELSEGRPVIVFPLVTNEAPPAPPPPANESSPVMRSPSRSIEDAPSAGTPPERKPPLGQGTRELIETMRPASPGGMIHVAELKGWCFLELDLDYLQKHLLPELIERHYGRSANTDYRIAVVTRRPPGIIYQSDENSTPQSFSRIDAGILLFDARVQPNRPGPPPAAQPPPPPPPPPTADAPPQEPLPRQPPPPNQAPPPFIAERGGAPINAIETGQPEQARDGADAWLLVLKSASGSLDTVANHIRLHNLFVNFGILIILAGSIVMLMLANTRAHRLAQQQMEFVAGISHELRTPLTVIQSTSYNLSKGVIQEQERVRKYGEVIQGEARRLINQVEQILSYAGIQSGRKLYDMRPVHVSLVIDRALAAYAAALEEGAWQVEREVDEDLPLVLADAQALESVIKNLIGNAIKYAAVGKWLTIRARATGSRRAREVQIVIADRGPGIFSQDLPHIFEPFYRGQEVYGSTNSGAGLGLSLVERHMQSQKGRVSVESSPTDGTVFTLHLPALEGEGNGAE
jgi:signal transduction histidine kinase